MDKLPQKFVDMLDSLPGHEEAANALLNTPSPVSVRMNPYKPMVNPDLTDRVPWEPDGYYLSERPGFTFHPGLYDGRFYVQDASSMITGEIVRRLCKRIGRPVVYLDACAAPGGKTTSAIANLPEGSFVLANEYERDRVGALIENLERWGCPNVAVSNHDGRKLEALGPIFDIVAVDAPCSGEGMMRKNETAITQWSPGLVEDCATLQRLILQSVWETLLPEGYLIYSTCTFNPTENEGNAAWIRDSLGAEPVDLELTDYPGVLPGIDSTMPCSRFVPGLVRGEGQFVAVFRKPGDSLRGSEQKLQRVKGEPLPPWLKGDFIGFKDRKGTLYAVKQEFAPLVSHIERRVNLVMPGVAVALPKGRDLMPAHALATSLALRPDAFSSVEVDYPKAIAFLRGEALRLEDVPKGYVLVKYNGWAIGWAKNIGSRANNLVPQQRRIKSTRTPDVCPELR